MTEPVRLTPDALALCRLITADLDDAARFDEALYIAVWMLLTPEHHPCCQCGFATYTCQMGIIEGGVN